MSRATADVAVVDLAPWYRGDRDAVASALDDALCDGGFALVQGHGVSESLLEQARAAADRFFALSAAAKRACVSTGPAHRGWFGPGVRSTAASHGLGTPPDLKETFVTGTTRTPEGAHDPTLFGPNVYPPEVPDFRQVWTPLRRQLFGLGNTLVDIAERALDLHAGTMSRHFVRTGMIVVANWYPSYRELGGVPPGAQRIGPHTDVGTFTLVDRRPSPAGVQVQHGQGWRDVPWRPGSLTLNVGDLMACWTGGRWPSTVHRIPAPSPDHPDEDLLSIVGFHRPAGDAIIEPMDGSEPVHCGEWMAARTAALAVEG